jgi:hypothetical protein
MTVGYKKEGSGAAFWLIIIFLAIAIAFGLWFWLKREEKPAKANPSQTSSIQHTASPHAVMS